MIRLDEKARPAPDAVVTELDNGEAVLLHLQTKMYYTLNETGVRIWQLLNEGLSAGEISVKIHGEFDVTPEKAQESVIRLFHELSQEKLIELITSPL